MTINPAPSVPACGACPGDGSICPSTCKVAAESPPVAQDIKELLREHLTNSMFINVGTLYAEMNSQRTKAAGHIEAQEQRITLLESESEQIRMSWKNAELREEELLDIVRTLVCMADRMAQPGSENYPSPLCDASPLMIAARQACIGRGFTEGGLAINAVMAKDAE